MHGSTRLSVRFLEAREAHQIRMLVNLTGEAPVRRPPINLALVLDRSGSMSGGPIGALRAAVGSTLSEGHFSGSPTH